jgi:hypothetical protein
MLCGLMLNALVTQANAGTMPVVGMPSTLHPASPMWRAATSHTRLPFLADQARLGLFSAAISQCSSAASSLLRFAYNEPSGPCSRFRAEERRRREQGQPHTMRDTALLLLTSLSVVGVLLCAMFLKPLNVLVNSLAGIAAIVLVVGGDLTYVFQSQTRPLLVMFGVTSLFTLRTIIHAYG